MLAQTTKGKKKKELRQASQEINRRRSEASEGKGGGRKVIIKNYGRIQRDEQFAPTMDWSRSGQ